MVKVKITKLTCKKCRHQWIPKQEDVRQCASCKTTYWNKTPEETRQ